MLVAVLSANELYFSKLKANGHSNTVIRSAVFGTLLDSEHTPLTMSQLVKRTEAYGNRASIYRSVKLLEETGIIKRLHIGWKYKLELSDDFHGHHHHITCVKCGETTALHDETLEKMVFEHAAKSGYKITDHMLDIRGICKKCGKK